MISDISAVKLWRWVTTSFPWDRLGMIRKEVAEPRYDIEEAKNALLAIELATGRIASMLRKLEEGEMPSDTLFKHIESIGDNQWLHLKKNMGKHEYVTKTDRDEFWAIIDDWIAWFMERILKAQHPMYKTIATNMMRYLKDTGWRDEVYPFIYNDYHANNLYPEALLQIITDNIIPFMNRYLHAVEGSDGKIRIIAKEGNNE